MQKILQHPMRVAIYGAGSLGTILGAHIARAGKQVHLYNRNAKHVAALREKGATIAGTENFVQPVEAFLDSEIAGKYDVIFLMTKQQENARVVTMLREHLTEDGVIVTTQNGLPEQGIADIVGAEHVIGCIVYWGASMTAPGVSCLTSEAASSRFALGTLTDKPNKHLEDVQKLLETMGPAPYDPEFMLKRWGKLLINTAFSGVSAAYRQTFGEITSNPETQAVISAIQDEVIAVAAAEGYQLERIDIVAFGKTQPNGKASMLQDIENGKPTEVNQLPGAVVAYGKKHGIPTPTIERIVKMVEEA